MKRITTLCTAGLLTLSTGAASATELLALGADGKLFKVDVASLKVTASMAVSGASDLRGLDVRPASGQLYALSGTDQLYTLDAANGKATAGSKLKTALAGSGQAVVDFNPAADRLRMLGPDGTSLRVNVDTGEVAVDGKVAYAADGPYAGKQPKVVAGAYTNAYAGTQSTALYNIDLASGSLMLQNPQNVIAHVTVRYLLSSGTVITRTYDMAPRSRAKSRMLTCMRAAAPCPPRRDPRDPPWLPRSTRAMT